MAVSSNVGKTVGRRAGARVRKPAKPLKRPTQARAKVTVQAIFDAFVRIWQRDGWARLTTRAVALEAGVAVGTLYDYFPSKTALQSGYVRHCIESLILAVDTQAVQPAGLAWRERVHRLVQLACGVSDAPPSWFHPDMLAIEPQVAEPKHQRRAHEELCVMWQRVFDACTDLPRRPSPKTVQALHLAVWGGRRYAMLVQLGDAPLRRWAAEMERLCRLALLAPETLDPETP
ncbi:MAG: TetR/AcrR family transcriptional regulator [Rhizobacter sp.]|nr:TetR/AcrR family transcriptional regulator [Rhizobacter sp.]